MELNGKKVETMELHNKIKNKKTNFLLSGHWAQARHANYTYEMLLSLCWSLFGYDTGLLVFTYFFYTSHQIPILHFSVIWWRSVHQQASILSQETVASGDAPMSSDILTTLLISVLLVTLVHVFLTKKFRINADKTWEDYQEYKLEV